MDFAILGSADHHMAWSMRGEVESTIHGGMSQGFKDECLRWQRHAMRACNHQIGYVMNRIEHRFHGKKKNRFYRERWQILVDAKYDPRADLKYDPQGVIQLIDKPELSQEIHRYNLSRQEDSIDLE